MGRSTRVDDGADWGERAVGEVVGGAGAAEGVGLLVEFKDVLDV